MKPSTDFFPACPAGTQWVQIANPVKPAKPAPIAGIDGNGGAVDAEGLPPALEMGNLQRDKSGKLSNPDCGVGRGFVVPVVSSAPRSSFTTTATDAFGMGASWWEDDYDRDAEKQQARTAAREARWDRGAAHFDRIPLSATAWVLLLSDLLCWAVLIAGCRLLSLGVMAIWHAMGGK